MIVLLINIYAVTLLLIPVLLKLTEKDFDEFPVNVEWLAVVIFLIPIVGTIMAADVFYRKITGKEL